MKRLWEALKKLFADPPSIEEQMENARKQPGFKSLTQALDEAPPEVRQQFHDLLFKPLPDHPEKENNT